MQSLIMPDDIKDGSRSDSGTLKLDGSGLPLIPQPTTSPIDPLNYPDWLKYVILVQASFLAALSILGIGIINPVVVPLAEEFNITPVFATYTATVAVGTGSLGPLIFTPLANVYGRRPAYLISVLIGLGSAVGAAKATTFGRLLVARAFTGLGPSAAVGIGAGTVVDLFYGHQRGRAMGIFILLSTNGAHLAPIIGGYIARDRGWRWCLWASAMINGAIFLIILFFMPETLFDRPENSTKEIFADDKEKIKEIEDVSSRREAYHSPPMQFKTYIRRLWFWDLDRPASRQIKAEDFVVRPLSLLKYPSVVFPVFYYSVTYGLAQVEPGLILATLFTKIYKFDTAQNGLANGLSQLIGATLGELCSGAVTDAAMRRARKRFIKGGEMVTSELRLQAIWAGAITVPIGLMMYGLTIHFAVNFIAPCVGMVIACFGVSSVCFTYSCSDCYRHRSNDVSLCFNFMRQIFGMTLGFYSIPFGERIGFEWSFTVFSALCIVSFLPIVALMYHGRRWRVALGEPSAY